MSVPGFQDFMVPILRLASDNAEHRLGESIEPVADMLDISSQARNERLPSGSQTLVYNRLCWAVTYLDRAGALERPARGRFRITERGRELLQQHPSRIDLSVLSQFPEFVEFREKRQERVDTKDEDREITPDERLEAAHEELQAALIAELLERVRTSAPRFFEQLVVDVLVSMGYGGSRADAAQVVGKAGDGGIDGVIKEDRLGLAARGGSLFLGVTGVHAAAGARGRSRSAKTIARC